MRLLHLTILFGLPGCLAVAGCGSKATPMLISVEQEIAIGRQVSVEVEREYGRPVTSGPRARRLAAVAGRILPLARRDVPYRVTALDNDEVVNALAAPGGPVYVTTALIDRMTDDGELAFVVGHEVAHIEAEHGRQAINQAVMVEAAAQLLLRDSGELIKFGSSVAWLLYSRGYSRANEREADSGGLRLMNAAGYPPGESIEALRKLGGGQVGGPARYLSTHPSTPDRIRRLEAEIAGLGNQT